MEFVLKPEHFRALLQGKGTGGSQHHQVLLILHVKFFNIFYLFIYFWQCWVLSLLCGLFSLVVANEGYFLVAVLRLLLLWNIDRL